MRVSRGTRKYENIVNNKIVVEEDNDFQKRSSMFGFEYLLTHLFSKIKVTREQNILPRERVVSITKPDGSKIYFSYFKVTNAGQESNRKRMQIPEGYFGLDLDGTKRNPKDLYFFIGLYPTGETKEPIYVLLDNDGVSLNPHESYSSLWINFNSLVIANKNGIHYAINKINGNKYVCFKQSHWSLLLKAILENDFTSIIGNDVVYIDKSGHQVTEEKANIVELYDEKRDAYVCNGKAKLKKNQTIEI